MTDGHPRFLQLLDKYRDTHIRKAAGYAGADNPDMFANFRESERLGIPAWLGCLVRMGDKWIRLTNLTRNPANDRVGETILDTVDDLIVYGIILRILLEETEATSVKLTSDPLESLPDSVHEYGPLTRRLNQ